jgi:RHS repeat-associated protein
VYLYNGKELQDEQIGGVNLDWYDFKWRYYDPQIGRFFTQDRLAEKFAYMSPYQFCSNNPIWLKELDGLEGIKYTDVDGIKNVEKNVVVLTEQKRTIPEGADQKTVDRLTRQNTRIETRNAAKINDTQSRLNDIYNGSDGTGSKNSAGETVRFKFNISALPTSDTEGGTEREVTALGVTNGIISSEKEFDGGPNKIAPAAVVTTRSTRGSLGLSNGVFVTESFGAPRTTIPHEVGHTFLLRDNWPSSTGGLMDYPAGGLIPSEVDEIWRKSYAK